MTRQKLFLLMLTPLVTVVNQVNAQWTASGTAIFNSNIGNVGIGTSSPANKLTIFDASANNTYLSVSNNSLGTFMGAGGVALGIVGTSTNHDLGLYTNNTEKIRITSTGNIGMGTTTPFKKLHVAGSSMVVTTADFTAGGTGSSLLLGQNGLSGNIYSLLQATIDGPNNGGLLALNPNGGNVSIGTTDPKGYKFAVNGSVIATSVTVKLYAAWPDFVFKRNYSLLPLRQVREYIYKNQRLPDMPSAAEIEQKGVDVGEMLRLQTRKIEELTLYLIDKDKELAAEHAFNKDLEKRIKRLEKAHKLR
ncbi:hypothetical protein ACFQZI_14810 [Mucilaginibacter lutimaris]|uniref:Uncharacterized protein n=1 Tax=Mucilaginibacter lutimaris TaxID=931629 RepID=A0ABW2ZIY3_9SPHI